MHVLASAVCAIASALICVAPSVHAANIDTDGYKQDGTTTYCQGRTAVVGDVEFPNLNVGNVDRCPVLLSLTTSASTVHQGESVDVTWKATAQFKEIPGNIFPHAVDVAKKSVNPVSNSFVKACKVGTNCATVFSGAAGAGAAAGAFDTTGLINLQAAKFTFPDIGDFVLVGKVTLPGDDALKVSASEFIVFKKISVVDKATSIAPSAAPTPAPSPTPSTSAAPSATTVAPSPSVVNSNSTSNLNFTNKASGASKAGDEAGTVSPDSGKATLPSPSDDTSTEGATTKTDKDDDKGFFASHGALLGAVAGICVIVLVVGYAVAMRRKKGNVNASKLQRAQTQTFRMSRSDRMDDPEPVEYIRKKSARNSNNHNSVPIMSRPSVDSTDGMPIDLSKRGSEMEPSFDEMDSSFVEGTITSSNHTVSTIPRKAPQSQPRPSSGASKESMAMLSSMYSEARSTAVYQGKKQEPVRQSEQERAFYKSEAWYPDATAGPQQREVSTISFADNDTDVDSNSRRGFQAPSFDSNSRRGFESPSFSSDFDVTERASRLNSEASVDSYAFRPSNVSAAESYKSRVSRYSGFSDDMDRESSRISGMSLYSDRDTNV